MKPLHEDVTECNQLCVSPRDAFKLLRSLTFLFLQHFLAENQTVKFEKILIILKVLMLLPKTTLAFRQVISVLSFIQIFRYVKPLEQLCSCTSANIIFYNKITSDASKSLKTCLMFQSVGAAVVVC